MGAVSNPAPTHPTPETSHTAQPTPAPEVEDDDQAEAQDDDVSTTEDESTSATESDDDHEQAPEASDMEHDPPAMSTAQPPVSPMPPASTDLGAGGEPSMDQEPMAPTSDAAMFPEGEPSDDGLGTETESEDEGPGGETSDGRDDTDAGRSAESEHGDSDSDAGSDAAP
jgi:hypothetical protein